MKKLMTMLAAAATAFGLYAADTGFLSGAAFDSFDADATAPENITWTSPSGLKAGYWGDQVGEKAKLNTVAEKQCDLAEASRPARFLKTDEPTRVKDGFLEINSNSELVSQKIKPTGTQLIDAKKGLYFDGLVQFTAFDETPTIADDAKIAVFPMVNDPDDESKGASLWIKSSGGTNLWKTAKAIDGTWHRVTIKMINNILRSGSQVGFVVYVDGEAVECAAAQAAFADPTALTAEANSYYVNKQLFGALKGDAQMTEVAFGGKGAIDEIAFTETAPTFAESPTFYTVAWDETTVASVTGLTTNPQDVEVSGAQVTYTYTAQPGYINGTTNITGVAGETYTITAAKLAASAEIDGVPQDFSDLASAIAAINGAQNSATLTLGADAGDITIDNTKEPSSELGATIVIDLAGKNTGKIKISRGEVTLTNSTDTIGHVIAESGNAIQSDDDGSLTVTAGYIDGAVKGKQDQMYLLGGKYLASANDPDDLNKYAPDDKEFVQKGDYYELTQKPDFKGEGTADSPWLIQSEKDLNTLKTRVAEGNTFAGKFFQQTADITLTEAWEGIGTYAKFTPVTGETYFGGVYDGDGKSISGLTFPTTNEVNNALNQQGLFRKVYSIDGSAEIKNLTVNVNYDASDNTEAGAAAVVGVLSNAKITGVTANGSIKGGHACSGIAGMVNGDSVLTDVTNNVDVIGYVNKGSAKAGGICNITQNQSKQLANDISGTPKFIRCVNTGDIAGKSPSNGVGGLVGYLDTDIEVEDCECYGSYAATEGTGRIGSIFGSRRNSHVVTMKGTNKAVATVVAGDAAFDGLNYATVDAGIATFVKDEAVVADGTYKVMTTGNAPTVALKVGESITFDQTLATIDATGITAPTGYNVKPTGTGTITYSLEAILVTSITLDITSTNVAPNEVFTLTATVLPDDALDPAITWTSSDDAIATVANGEVAAVAAGTATITATNAASGQFATCTVTVEAATPELPGEEILPADQKDAYKAWATKNGVTAADTALANDLVVAWKLGVDKVENAAAAVAAAKEKVDVYLKDVDLSALAAGGTAEDALAALNTELAKQGLEATLKAVPKTEIETTASLYRLQISAKVAN